MNSPEPRWASPKVRAISEHARAQKASPLDDTERTALLACEAVIEEGLGAFVNVGNALVEIHRRRLYRDEYGTFEQYCAQRWGLSRSQGHRLVLAERVAMSPIGDKIRNESQAREISSLLDDPEHLQAVVERAEAMRGDRPLTARALRQARAEILVPDSATVLRQIYDAGQAYEKSWRASLDLYVRLLCEMPVQGWPLLTQRPSSELLVPLLMGRLALDADLTPAVVAILRRWHTVSPRDPITAAFTSTLGLTNSMTEFAELASGAMPERDVAAVTGSMRTFGAGVAARMAELLTALALDPVDDGALNLGPLDEAWQERIDRWNAAAPTPTATKTVLGPLAREIGDFVQTSREIADRLQAQLGDRPED